MHREGGVVPNAAATRVIDMDARAELIKVVEDVRRRWRALVPPDHRCA